MPSEIKLPKLKENVDTVEVSEVLVAPGQVVALYRGDTVLGGGVAV